MTLDHSMQLYPGKQILIKIIRDWGLLSSWVESHQSFHITLHHRPLPEPMINLVSFQVSGICNWQVKSIYWEIVQFLDYIH